MSYIWFSWIFEMLLKWWSKTHTENHEKVIYSLVNFLKASIPVTTVHIRKSVLVQTTCKPSARFIPFIPAININLYLDFFFLSFFFLISWRLITLQYCSGFCHTLTWISLGYTCTPHPDPPSHLPLHPIPLGLPSAPGPSTCLMHPTWAGDLFHPR